MKIVVLLSFLIISINTLSGTLGEVQNSMNEVYGTVDEVDRKLHFSEIKNLYKQARAEGKRQKKIEEENRKNQTSHAKYNPNELICVSCNELLPLIRNINFIMNKMIVDKTIDESKVGALESIEQLEALYSLVESELANSGEVQCEVMTSDIRFLVNKENLIKDSELEEIFSFNIPLDKINAFHFRDRKEKRKIYYYRAKKPYDNVIIKITVPKDGEARVQYFTDGIITPKIVLSNEEKEKLRQDEEKKKEEKLKKDTYGYATEFGDKKSDDYMRLGLEVETSDYYIPKKLKILEAKGKLELTGGYKIRGEAEISDRDQEAQATLSKGNDDYLVMKTKANGDYYVGMPLAIDINQTIIKNEVYFDQDSSGAKIALTGASIGFDSINMVFDKPYEEDQFRTQIEAHKKLSEHSSFSVNIRDDSGVNGGQRSMWLRYSYSF